MCGIVGYTGTMETAPILIEGLSRLEYRGYDSAGIAVTGSGDGSGAIEVIKAKGRLQALCEMTDSGRTVKGTCGIGHTRWATHGDPSVVNAHPHFSKDKKIAVVHNGIIENYKELREWLRERGRPTPRQTQRWLYICWTIIIKTILWRRCVRCWAVFGDLMLLGFYFRIFLTRFLLCVKTAR